MCVCACVCASVNVHVCVRGCTCACVVMTRGPTYRCDSVIMGSWSEISRNRFCTPLKLATSGCYAVRTTNDKIREVRKENKFVPFWTTSRGPQINRTWPEFPFQFCGKCLSLAGVFSLRPFPLSSVRTRLISFSNEILFIIFCMNSGPDTID